MHPVSHQKWVSERASATEANWESQAWHTRPVTTTHPYVETGGHRWGVSGGRPSSGADTPETFTVRPTVNVMWNGEVANDRGGDEEQRFQERSPSPTLPRSTMAPQRSPSFQVSSTSSSDTAPSVALPPRYHHEKKVRVKMCHQYIQTGHCRFGARCLFHHIVPSDTTVRGCGSRLPFVSPRGKEECNPLWRGSPSQKYGPISTSFMGPQSVLQAREVNVYETPGYGHIDEEVGNQPYRPTGLPPRPPMNEWNHPQHNFHARRHPPHM